MENLPSNLKGKLLLDGGNLRGSFFHRSVVLICQHDEEGAMGFVLNRSSGTKVGDMNDDNLGDSLKDEVLLLGGPVQPSAMSFIHIRAFNLPGDLMSQLNVGHSLDDLREIGESFPSTENIRVFAGYSGWSAGQLEEELKRKSWLVHEATQDLVFFKDMDKLWKHILKNKGWQYKLLAEAPEDPSWN